MSDSEGQQLTAAQRSALEADLADMEGPQRAAAVQAIAQAKTVPPVPLQDLHAEPVVEESHVVG